MALADIVSRTVQPPRYFRQLILLVALSPHWSPHWASAATSDSEAQTPTQRASNLVMYVEDVEAAGPLTQASTGQLRRALGSLGVRVEPNSRWQADAVINIAITKSECGLGSMEKLFSKGRPCRVEARIHAYLTSQKARFEPEKVAFYSDDNKISQADLEAWIREYLGSSGWRRDTSEASLLREESDRRVQAAAEAKQREQEQLGLEMERQAAEDDARAKEAEARAWQAASMSACRAPKASADCDAVRSYLAAFPSGEHAAEATGLLSKADASLADAKQAAKAKFMSDSVRRNASKVAALGFPKRMLVGTVYLQVDFVNRPQPTMTLEQLLSLLFENKSITSIKAARAGASQGVKVKVPGSPSTGFLLSYDEGDLFVTHGMNGDSVIPVTTVQDSLQVSMVIMKLAADSIPGS